MKKKRPANRPYIEIEWDTVDKWLEAGCSGTEIAAKLGFCSRTLYDHCIGEKKMTFSEYAATKRAKGDGQLKVKQYAEAMKGDRGMLIWLGKQRLGQKENHDVNLNGGINIEIVRYGDTEQDPWSN